MISRLVRLFYSNHIKPAILVPNKLVVEERRITMKKLVAVSKDAVKRVGKT